MSRFPSPPPPPPEQVEKPKDTGPSPTEKLDQLIAEAQAYAKSRPKDVDGQIARWKKARTEAATQRSPKGAMIQDQIKKLRSRN